MPEVTFDATTDTWISNHGSWRERNSGWDATMRLERKLAPIPYYSTRLLMQFNLSQIAPGSTINSVEFRLARSGTGGSQYGASLYYMVNNGWSLSANYYYQNPEAGIEWPGVGQDPPNPRNYATNEVHPNFVLPFTVPVNDLVIYSSSHSSLVFPISAAVNNTNGLLSLQIRPDATAAFIKYYKTFNHSVGPPPQLVVNWSPPSYALTITESPTAGGSLQMTSPLSHPGGVAIVSGEAVYLQEGEVATIVATDADTYEFVNWTGDDSGDVSGTHPTFTITMDAAKAIQANWAVTTYKLTLNEGANGADALTPNGAAPLHTYEVDESFLLVLTPDAGYQLDEITVVAGQSPLTLVTLAKAEDGHKWITALQFLAAAAEWTTVYKALWTLTTNEVGGAHGTVAFGAASPLTWPQHPLFAANFPYIVSIKPDVGYQVQVAINVGTIVNIKGTNLDIPIFGLEATDWLFTPPDSDATLTVTWKLIAAGQTGGGLFHKPYDDNKGKLIL